MKQIINSILDNDHYTFTQQAAILELFPNVEVEYKFINRRKDVKFDDIFLKEFNAQIKLMENLKLTDTEYIWLSGMCPYYKPQYLAYLKNYKFNSNEVAAKLDVDGNLEIDICGVWSKTIMWEVVILALICEIYYTLNDKLPNMDDFKFESIKKRSRLSEEKIVFNDFGTRRRRSFGCQDTCVKVMKESPYFFGTSNVYLAMKHGVKPVGTQSHQWTMGVSALIGLRHANKFAMEKWSEVYKGDIGVALPDTFTTDVFLEDFDLYFAKLFDAVRQDSGCPFEFADKIVNHYKKLKIDPMTKLIIFSDALDVDKAIALNTFCKGKIRSAFGIGTHFTGQYGPGTPLNIVCKLNKVAGIPVIKLSDSPTKAIGDKDALRVSKWTFFGTSLDA